MCSFENPGKTWVQSPWGLSASDRRGTAPCLPLTSPSSSACPDRCPWRASPGSCRREEIQAESAVGPSSLPGPNPTDGRTDGRGAHKSRRRSRDTSAVKTSRSPITWRTHTHTHPESGWEEQRWNFLRSSYIFMLHVFEQPQLPVGPLGEQFGLEGSVQLLDGHLGPPPSVPGWAENTEFCLQIWHLQLKERVTYELSDQPENSFKRF